MIRRWTNRRRLRRARSMRAQGDLEGALDLVDQVLQEPTKAETREASRLRAGLLVDLGKEAAEEENWSSVASHLAHAREAGRLDQAATVLLARAQMEQGLVSEAETTLGRSSPSEDREPLVLRAYCRAALGNWSGSVEDFRSVQKNGGLRRSERLALGEILIEAGDLEAASRLVGGEPSDVREKILRARIEAAQGREEGALQRLRPLLADPGVSAYAVSEVLLIARRNPSAPGLVEALSDFDERVRDDAYWIVLGNAHLGSDLGEAMRAWSRVEAPSPDRLRAFQEVLCRGLSSLIDKKEYVQARRAWCAASSCARTAEAEALATIAICRAAIEAGSEGPDAVLETLSECPRGHRHERLIRGVALAAVGRYAEGLPILRQLDSEEPLGPEALLQLTRFSLLAGPDDERADLLEERLSSDERATSVRLAVRTARGDWQGVSRVLDFVGEEAVRSRASDLVRLHIAERDGESSATASPRGSYERAVALFESEDDRGGIASLAEIASDHDLRPDADRLVGWSMLRRIGLEIRHAGDRPLDELGSALSMWPEAWERAPWQLLFEAGIAAGEDGGEGCSAALAAMSERVVEPSARHVLAVYHYLRARAHREARDPGGTLFHGRRALANLATVLVDGDYMNGWFEERAATYGTQLGEAARKGFPDRLLGALWGSWTPSDEDEGDRAPGPGQDLYLESRAELAGARLLITLGGIPLSGRRTGFGLTFSRIQGLGNDVAAILDGVKVRPSLEFDPDDPVLSLVRAMSDEADTGSLDAEGLSRARRLFSSIRLASVLLDEGRPGHCLDLLASRPDCPAESAQEPCLPLAQGPCAEEPSTFGTCNPGFLGQSPSGLRDEAKRLEVRALRQLGEKALAKGDDRDSVVEHWRAALEGATACGLEKETRRAIVDAVLGRCRVLVRRDEEAAAIEILEEIEAIVQDTEIQSMLATCHTNLGVLAANRDQDVDRAAGHMREAYAKNPHAKRVVYNFAAALLGQAMGVKESAPERAIELLEEAQGVIDGWGDNGAHDEETAKLRSDIRAALGMMRIRRGDADPMAMLEVLAGATGEGARKMSTIYHNRAAEKLREGDVAAAVRGFEEALRLEPDSEVTRKMLASALNQRAVESANAKRFDEALADIRRARDLDGEDETISKNLDSIGKARLFDEMRKGKLSQQRLQQLLREMRS